jgi:hypothetical protein
MKIIRGSPKKWPKMGVLQGLNGGGSLSFLWALSIGLCHTSQPDFVPMRRFRDRHDFFFREQGIATLTFDNPSRRNALGAAELDAIERALGGIIP